MYAKLTVSLKDNGRVIGQVSGRPARLTPDGVAGIVYDGRVYPVHEGNYVDLGDESFEKSECDRFVEDGTPIPYASADSNDESFGVTKWYVEQNSFGTYLVFDSDKATAERLVRFVRDFGIEVRRWGASSRMADDGYHYDWFIRLGHHKEYHECVATVNEALVTIADEAPPLTDIPAVTGDSDFLGGHFAELDEDALSELQALVTQGLQSSIDAIQLALANAVKRAEVAESEIHKLKDERASWRASQTAVEKTLAHERSGTERLRAQLADAERRVAAAEAREQSLRDASTQTLSHRDESRKREQELREENASLRRERDEACRKYAEGEKASFDLNNEVEAKVKELTEKLAVRDARVEQLECELAESTRAPSDQLNQPSVAGRNRKAGDARQILSRAWPKLIIHPDSFKLMAARFLDLSDVFDRLHKLDRGEPQAAEPWSQYGDVVYEVRDELKTGRDNRGRIYYRKLSGDRWWVFLHYKKDGKEQERFVRNIANKDPAKAQGDLF